MYLYLTQVYACLNHKEYMYPMPNYLPMNIAASSGSSDLVSLSRSNTEALCHSRSSMGHHGLSSSKPRAASMACAHMLSWLFIGATFSIHSNISSSPKKCASKPKIAVTSRLAGSPATIVHGFDGSKAKPKSRRTHSNGAERGKTKLRTCISP
jgi:hypothetical protein